MPTLHSRAGYRQAATCSSSHSIPSQTCSAALPQLSQSLRSLFLFIFFIEFVSWILFCSFRSVFVQCLLARCLLFSVCQSHSVCVVVVFELWKQSENERTRRKKRSLDRVSRREYNTRDNGMGEEEGYEFIIYFVLYSSFVIPYWYMTEEEKRKFYSFLHFSILSLYMFHQLSLCILCSIIVLRHTTLERLVFEIQWNAVKFRVQEWALRLCKVIYFQ